MKLIFKVLRGGWLVALMLVPLSVTAHHSQFGRYDTDTISELEGEITRVQWRNPHVIFWLSVTAPDGQAVTWEIETTALGTLRRMGVTSDLVNVGDRVVVAGTPPTGEIKEMFAHNLLTPDGTELLMDRRAQVRWSDQSVGSDDFWSETAGDSSSPELGIFRVWSFTFESPVIFPETFSSVGGFDIYSYPMTDSARAAVAEFDLVADNPTQNCTPKGMPTIMEQPYPIEFVRQDENIVINIEEYDLTRTIHMGASSSTEEQPASPLGYSVGSWDGDTLVVTTTRVNWPYYTQAGIPQSEAVEIVEQFTPSSDGSRLDYVLTVTDPATFTEPVEQEKYWIWRPQETVEPFDCLVGG
jgi:hypothetical protein